MIPRATSAGLAGLALAALGVAVGGLFYAPALPFGLGALAGLSGAVAVGRWTFTLPLDRYAPGPGDPLDRLRAQVAAAVAVERAAGEQRLQAQAEAAHDAADTEAAQRRQGEASRAALARALGAALKALADGDLTTRLDAPELAREFEAALALYGKTVYALASSAAAIQAGVREIADDAESLARGARTEAERLGPARAVLREAAEETARLARDGQKARESAVSLRAALESAFAALDGGATAFERVAGGRAKLRELAEKIDGFAFQTQLIALNAGVEAARAGEAGRGIAIVAQELRGLSQRSTEATRELKGALALVIAETDKGAVALREAADVRERAMTALPPAIVASDGGRLAQLEQALEAAQACVLRDAEAGEAVGAASRSLEALVAKLAALAGHFRLPGAPNFEIAAAPRALPPPRPRPARLRAIQNNS